MTGLLLMTMFMRLCYSKKGKQSSYAGAADEADASTRNYAAQYAMRSEMTPGNVRSLRLQPIRIA